MGAQDSTSQPVLEVFSRAGGPGTPLTTSEVADELECARRTAYGKLEDLADAGELETKKVGARGRVWWRPVEPSAVGGQRDKSDLEQAQFYELVEAVTDYAIFVLDAEGHVQTWNDGAKQIKGYDEDEIVGEHFSRFYTEEEREADRPERNLEAAREHGRIEDEGWRVRNDGSRFWANVTITALWTDDDELQGYVKITRDMTERHEYEERLRTEKKRFETLVREVKDYAIFMLDEEGVVETWNEGAKQLKGYEEDEIVGEHFSRFYTEEDREAGRPEKNLVRATEDGRVEDEGWRVTDEGNRFWANVTITALFDDDGELRGYAKVTRDMTDRHRYEERLREQRDELDELNQINTVIRDIDKALVTATTQEEIEEAVCERLAASDTYAAAWTAEYTEDYEQITPRAWAGIDDEYLAAIRSAETGDGDELERGVGATALQTGTIQPVQTLQGDGDEEPWREASLAAGYESAIAIPLAHDGVEYGVLTVYADDESAFDERKVAVMSELGEMISHAIAAIRRKERELTLTALQESTRQLLHTTTRAEVGDVIVETLTDDLGLADALVYSFDTTENVLEPVSASFQSDSRASEPPSLAAGADSPVWESFVEGEPRHSESAIPSREIGRRRSMVVPLGDRGVLAVAAAEQETFDEDARRLVELVATTAAAAFDRIESQANLRERDELLQEQNQRLQRLNHINTIIREVDQGLVQATTREEVERVVCERLTRSDRFRFAWIGRRDEIDEGLTPRAYGGDGHGYLDSVELRAATRADESEPALLAARTDDVTVVSNVADDIRGGQWRKEAFSREFQSVIAVPLTYGDVAYGVLAVYGDRPEVFDEMEQTVFAELGQTIANAINAVETKQALAGDRAVELELLLRDESLSFLARVARQLDSEITFDGAIPLSANRARVFFVAGDAAPAEIEDVLERSVAVESGQVIAETGDGHLVEAVVSGRTVALTLIEYGASLRSLSVTDEGVHLTVDVPADEDVREFIERFQATYEGTKFIARRRRDRRVRTQAGMYAELADSITERQLEVLKTAYYSGYFDSPRRSTGGDVADLLGVSQPTVTEQLRTAQCKVFDLLFTERPTSA